MLAAPGTLAARVDFYTALSGTTPDMDMAWPEAGIHIVAVGAFLILELDPERHPLPAATQTSLIVADLDTAVATAVAGGAAVEEARHPVPVGAAARLRHPDGMLVEYLEHRPSPYDVEIPPLTRR